jgi:DivIVA domain-containing protein
VIDYDPYETSQSEIDLPPGLDPGRSLEVRDLVPQAIRNVSFPAAVRGYDRKAVDTYVEHVNRVIAELEVTRSPQAAVRNALDRVGEQTSGILQRARATAEEITTSAREEAEDTVARARSAADDTVFRARARADEIVEAAETEAEQIGSRSRAEVDEYRRKTEQDVEEHRRTTEHEVTTLQEQAEARLHELQTDTEAVRAEREKLIADLCAIAARLGEMAGEAATRFTAPAPVEAEPEAVAEEPVAAAAAQDEAAAPEGGDPTIVAVADELEGTRAMPALDETSDDEDPHPAAPNPTS